MKKIITLLKTAVCGLESPDDFSANEIKQLKADIRAQLTDLECETMTGLMVSLDDGETWQKSSGVRVMFMGASESEGGVSEDLLLNVTTEGLILDLTDSVTGEVEKTACLDIESLIGLTQ